MKRLQVKINNVKNIKVADLSLPIEGGLYGIVGGNGCGKSTLMLIMSVIISSKRYQMLQAEDYDVDSSIDISIINDIEEFRNYWHVKTNSHRNNNYWWCSNSPTDLNSKCRPVFFKGVYEGSLFYGTRFRDSTIVDKLLRDNLISEDKIVDAIPYVKENLSFILHGDHVHYADMKKIKNKRISEDFELDNLPYFMTTNKGQLLSQYRMSSGECLLISLINYIYHTLINQGTSKSLVDKPFFIFIDEIELALHPLAISRLIKYLDGLMVDYPNLCVYLSSHSPEVIRSLKPQNMFMLTNNDGVLDTINPCFPSYAIREVYTHDGYDVLILVEDVLTSLVVQGVLSDLGLKDSRLIHISPVGGWSNVLNLHFDLLSNNVIGVNKRIISVLDGDVVSDVSNQQQFKNLQKIFLPIHSVEKFLFSIVFNGILPKLKKIINDKYFTIQSLDELAAEHNRAYKKDTKGQNKLFYFRLKKNLENRGITEPYFISNLSEDIKKVIDFSVFKQQLNDLLSR